MDSWPTIKRETYRVITLKKVAVRARLPRPLVKGQGYNSSSWRKGAFSDQCLMHSNLFDDQVQSFSSLVPASSTRTWPPSRILFGLALAKLRKRSSFKLSRTQFLEASLKIFLLAPLPSLYSFCHMNRRSTTIMDWLGKSHFHRFLHGETAWTPILR